MTFSVAGFTLNDITTETFKLPTLSQRLSQVSTELYEGRGISVINGLQPDMYSMEDNVIIHAGICSHIAPLRGCQSASNDMICELAIFFFSGYIFSNSNLPWKFIFATERTWRS